MIALVAHPEQAALVRVVAQSLPVAAVCSPWRAASPRTSELASYPTLAALLDTHPVEAVVFLRPYTRLAADLAECDRRDLGSLAAGPVSASPRRRWGGQHRWAPLIRQAQVQAQRPAFGRPVYLRRVSGGGTDFEFAWWSACLLLDEAHLLIGAAPDSVQVAASRIGGKFHLVLGAAYPNGAHAHLVVSPHYFSPSTDLTLLGSGGLLFSDPPTNLPVAVHARGTRLHQPAFLHPEPAWIRAYLAGEHPEPDPADLGRHHQLRAVLRRALRTGFPEALTL